MGIGPENRVRFYLIDLLKYLEECPMNHNSKYGWLKQITLHAHYIHKQKRIKEFLCQIT